MYTEGWKHLANKCVAFHGCDIRIPNTSRLPFSELFRKLLNFPQIKKKRWEVGKVLVFFSREQHCYSVAWTQPSQCRLTFKGSKEDPCFFFECLNTFFSGILAGPNKAYTALR